MRDGGGWTAAGTHPVSVCFSDDQVTVLKVEDGSVAGRRTGTRRWKHQEVMSCRELVHQEQDSPSASLHLCLQQEEVYCVLWLRG